MQLFYEKEKYVMYMYTYKYEQIIKARNRDRNRSLCLIKYIGFFQKVLVVLALAIATSFI